MIVSDIMGYQRKPGSNSELYVSQYLFSLLFNISDNKFDNVFYLLMRQLTDGFRLTFLIHHLQAALGSCSDLHFHCLKYTIKIL